MTSGGSGRRAQRARWRRGRPSAASGCPSAPRRARSAPTAAATSAPSAASPTTVMSRHAAEDHRQAGPDQRVVVDDQHAHGGSLASTAGHGSHGARARKSPLPESRPWLEPAAGQAGPLGEPDHAGAGARDAVRRPAPTGSGLRTSTVRPSPGRARRPHVDRPRRRACLRALVSPSWTIRYALRPTAAGTAAAVVERRLAAAPACPPPATPRPAPGRSASVGWGARARRRRRPRRAARRSPRRRSCSAWWALARITPAARATSSGGASGRNSSAPGVQAQQRDPVRQHVVHLPGDPGPFQLPGLRDPQLLLGLGPLRPVPQRHDELPAGPDEHPPGEHRDA